MVHGMRTDEHRDDIYDDDLYDDDIYALFMQTAEYRRFSEADDRAEAEHAVRGAACDAAYATFKANAAKSHYGCPTCAALANADV
jgi:hypothetical protein